MGCFCHRMNSGAVLKYKEKKHYLKYKLYKATVVESKNQKLWK